MKLQEALKLVKNESTRYSIEEKSLSMEEMYSLHPTYFKFAAQLSFYAMLNPDLVKQPYGHILFNLTSASFDNYPTYSKVRFPLFPAEQVMEFATNRIKLIEQHLTDGTYPLCSKNEMGTKPAEYKVLRMNKSGKWATVRGSKTDSLSEVQAFIASKGKVGDKLDETPARHVLCGYCSYTNVCQQFTGNV